MSESDQLIEQQRELLREASSRGAGAKLAAYVRLSGPGWLQSAITLGGGSLGGSLFLGILAGYNLLWLQILAMACGVVMLSAIGYVALSTEQKPFGLINRRVNPVLGWGWALATLAANIVWCLPQFALADAAVRENLAPGLADQKLVVCLTLLVVALCITMLYDAGSRGVKIYENTLRVFVALIVLSFFGVVIKLIGSGGVNLGEVFSGLIPDLKLLSNPSPSFDSALAATGEFREFWSSKIVAMQRDVMMTAAATAVGINMTFLLPYSMLRKGWDRNFRGLAIFDLATGMAIPFILATGCVVVASASQFHAKPATGLEDVIHATSAEEVATRLPDADDPQKADTVPGDYVGLLKARLEEGGSAPQDGKRTVDQLATEIAQLPEADRELAAMLVKRSAFQLASSLAPLTGDFVANYVFGFGVLAMALSTITILMLISGFTFCEILGLPQKGMYRRIGSLLPAVGVLGPFFWKQASFWLVVPTSVFGLTLLPIAYVTFFLLMNSRSVLGDAMPRGGRRLLWNVLMLIALVLSALGAGWAIWDKAGIYGAAGVGLFIALAVAVHVARGPQSD